MVKLEPTDGSHKIVTFRLGAMILGFFTNFWIGNLLLSKYTDNQFLIFTLLINIPSLFPFVSLGLNLNVFINFSNFLQKKISMNEATRNVTRIAGILVLSAIVTMLASSIYIEFHQIRTNTLISETKGATASLYFIVLIAMLCVPLNLSFSMLHGKGEFLRVILIQGMIPILNLFGYIMFGSVFKVDSIYLALIPSVSFLLSTLCATKVSGLLHFIDFKVWSFDKRTFRNELKLGFSNLIVISIVGWSTQLPRYYLSTLDYIGPAVEYGKISIFLVPIQGLATTYGYSLAKTFREEERHSDMYFLLEKIKKMYLVTLPFLIVFWTISALTGNRIALNLNDQELFALFLLVITSVTWIFLAVIQSEERAMSRNALVLGSSLLLFILLTITVPPLTLDQYVFKVAIPFNIFNTFLLLSPFISRRKYDVT